MIKPLLLTVFSSLALAFLAQRPAGGELDDILRQAAKGRQAYIDGFKDLTTIETRVTELLDKNGRTEQQQTVVSDFLIYQSRFKNDVASEYRITREINGKAARHPTDEALKFFRELAKAKTLAEENQTIREQNSRHVLRFLVWGLSLQPVPPIRQDSQHDFDFAVVGRERLGDHDTIGFGYQSKELRPVGQTMARALFRRFKSPRSGQRGHVWLDGQDWRIRRWVDETLGVDDEITTPVVVARKDIEYEPNPVGLLLPRRIVNSTFGRTAGKESPRTMRPLTRITFTYEPFRRFEVSTATDIKEPGRD